MQLKQFKRQLVLKSTISVMRKFSLRNVIKNYISAQFPENFKVETAQIEEAFLVNEDARYEEDKIKKRGMNNSYTYQRKYRTKRN